MCFKTQADIEAAKIAIFWEKRWAEGYRWNPANEFNAFDHPKLLVSTMEEPNEMVAMNWGLIPFWVKSTEQAKQMINATLNATSENVFDLPSFRGPIMKKRCVIYVTGFYEYQHNEMPGSKKVEKKKFLVKTDEPTFALGGIYDEWADRDTGEIYKGFSIITLEANELMTKIHYPKKRMPLIFENKEVAAEWLVPMSKEEIQGRIKKFPSERMYAEAV